MALGASWNAQLDTPITDTEAAATLDTAKRKEFLKAIERDNTIADQVIADAAEHAEGGIVTRIPTRRPGSPIIGAPAGSAQAEPLTITIEREANRVLAEERARAAIPPGTPVPGIGTTTEGLVFEPAPGGRKRPAFVSVVIAEGPSPATGQPIRAIRRRGRYLLLNPKGQVVESEDNLALLLLLFALLEKKRRDAEAKREQEANRA